MTDETGKMWDLRAINIHLVKNDATMYCGGKTKIHECRKALLMAQCPSDHMS